MTLVFDNPPPRFYENEKYNNNDEKTFRDFPAAYDDRMLRIEEDQQLGEITWSCFVATLNLIICELHERIILLSELRVQHSIVLFTQLLFSFLQHALTDHLNLFESEQRHFWILSWWSIRATRAFCAHLAAARFRVLHLLDCM